MAEASLQRLLELSAQLPNPSLRAEQRELVQSLARDLNVSLPDGPAEETTKKISREESREGSVTNAREKFQKQAQEQDQQNTLTRKEARRSSVPARSTPAASSAPTGNAECDISSVDIKNAYDQVRDDGAPTNWMLLGYGSSKKTLELYGQGEGSLKELVSNLKEDEVTYGYVRVIYGDSQRSKFVFVTYVPEGLSGMAKAKANMHKPTVIQFLKYMHVEICATTTAELDETLIQAKLTAAAGANYGTGGIAPTGSENYGSIKDNAKNFFQQTESKGNRQSIVYNNGPLAETTPVALQGRAGITEKYIKV